MASVFDLVRYGGPPAPSLAAAPHAWRVDPLVLAAVLVAAGGYLFGVWRVRRAGGQWPVARTLAFFGVGLVALAATTMGWLGVYAPVLFSAYAMQVVALLMVVPLLLALGRPIELAKAALGPAGSARLDTVLHSRPARLFTVPVVSPLLLALIPFLVFFTPWYQATLQHPVLASLTHLALLLAGLAVLVPIWEADTIAAPVPYLLALMFALIELLADAVPGIVIRLDTHVIAGAYLATLGRPWGGSLLHDQQLGGDFLWCIGEAVDVPFLGLLLLQWVRADAREARRVDEALDVAGADGGTGAPGDEDGGFGVERPWWETDASVFGDRAAQFQRRDHD
ncbi:cytochrome c oxidase assembly protein [Dactylosporangium sp. NPDC048998]|uniref:cytochrome c oxidase assembly protein n=1 Tax=Dactylosporangium sp. NPDC048998 TaxID=3363976 RepID=UPI00371DF4F7